MADMPDPAIAPFPVMAAHGVVPRKSKKVAAAESVALAAKATQQVLLSGYQETTLLVTTATANTGSSMASPPMLPESSRLSIMPPAYGCLPRHDPQVSYFSMSPRDLSPKMHDFVPAVPVVPALDLNATPMASQSTGTQRERPWAIPIDNFPDASFLFDGMPTPAPDNTTYYNNFIEEMIYEGGQDDRCQDTQGHHGQETRDQGNQGRSQHRG
ncbi:hypothetical protein TRIUR3_20848 [Triticum urartu]|uniref:Uncharacterized protein n=1 Tax=Triticum urartu TaxID=4572 RepID=M7YZE3_TRIUA|nr:hypothetical protein TRIUR3_20848 [Triticum urartu]